MGLKGRSLLSLAPSWKVMRKKNKVAALTTTATIVIMII